MKLAERGVCHGVCTVYYYLFLRRRFFAPAFFAPFFWGLLANFAEVKKTLKNELQFAAIYFHIYGFLKRLWIADYLLGH